MGLLTKNNALALDDGKLALNTPECRAKCGCGCWYPVYQCVCDDRGVATVNFFWPCNWEIPLDNLETQRFPSFQFEDLCYNIFLDSPITSIPEGSENQEFPESEVGALQWFDSCEGDPAQPDVITGCCDTCERTCEAVCSSAYTASVSLSYEWDYDNGLGFVAEISGCNDTKVFIIEHTFPPDCSYPWQDQGTDMIWDGGCACEYNVIPDDGGNPHPVTHATDANNAYFEIHQECDPASSTEPGDFDPYWVAVLEFDITIDPADCNTPETGANNLGTHRIEWRKDGPCPYGNYTFYSSTTADPNVTFNASASTLVVA